MNMLSKKDFWAGSMFIVIGAAVAWVARGYQMGTASAMGPGFFPFCLGVLLLVVGLGVALPSLRTEPSSSNTIDAHNLRPLGIVVLSVILFGLTLSNLGLVCAVIVVVVVSSLASYEFSWRTTLIATLILLPLTLITFVYFLGLPLQMLPPFFRT